jgi:hypothetical protein
MWIYLRTKEEHNWLYTVGFYKPNGEFVSVEDTSLEGDARYLVHYLNGGSRET